MPSVSVAVQQSFYSQSVMVQKRTEASTAKKLLFSNQTRSDGPIAHCKYQRTSESMKKQRRSGVTINVHSGVTINVHSGVTINVHSGVTITVHSSVTITVHSGVTITVHSGITMHVHFRLFFEGP